MSFSRAWSWRHAIVESDLDATTRHVLLTISLKMDETGGGCYPPISELMAMTGRSKNTIRKALEDAKNHGWLSVKKHGFRGQRWRRNEYVAEWPNQVSESPVNEPFSEGKSSEKISEGGSATDPPCEKKVGQPLTQGGSATDPKVGQPLTQDKTLPDSSIPSSVINESETPRKILVQGLGEQNARDLIEHRKKLRKPMTARAAKLLVREIHKSGDSDGAVDAIVSQGWIGFKAEWLNNLNNRGRVQEISRRGGKRGGVVDYVMGQMKDGDWR